jgi:ABC-type amino acid transport substrate-binding protein
MRGKATHRRLAVGTLAAALALVGAACGNDDETSTNSGRAAQSEQTVLKVGIDPTYRPFGFYDDKNQLTGYDVDLAQALAKKMNAKLELVEFNFDGLVASLDSGQFDVKLSLIVTPEREKQLLFGDKQFQTGVTVVVREGDPNPPDDLKGVKVGVASGTGAQTALEAFSDIKPTTYNSVPDAYTDLLAKRIDAVAVEIPNAGYSTKYTYPGKLRVTQQSLVENGAIDAPGMKKGNTELAQKLNKAMAEVRADGTIAEIEEKWFGFRLS